MSAVAARPDGPGTRATAVGDGQTFTAEGFDAQVHGTWHAAIHPYVPRVTNVGFLIDGALNDIGTAMVGGFLGERGPGVPARYRRLAPGATVRIGLSERAR
ncbi:MULTISPECIES: hypothetical protein [Streptomyces]|uniref:hypothetical protein n=1 Tax=Streptomyces TaxID=1883 RepID=UPI00067C0416|nr:MULTISPECIES: hypothetical protein [Streptomyces]